MEGPDRDRHQRVADLPKDQAGRWTRLAAVPRMAKAALTGRYPGLAKGRLGLMLAGLVYLVSPLDLVPDFLLVIGFADDLAVASWLLTALVDETGRFLAWERDGRLDGRRVVPGEVV